MSLPLLSDLCASVARAAKRAPLPPVLAALSDAGLPPSPARAAALSRLSREPTALVVPGQQVGLFLGPLYSVYKAATAIALAEQLTQRTATCCLPLFWLQTEDHDFAEVCGTSTLTSDGDLLSLRLPPRSVDRDRTSLAHHVLGPEILPLVEQLAEHLAPLPYADDLLPVLAAAYRPGHTLGQAFALLLSWIFHEDGLLILDPRTPALAALAAPVLAHSLEHAEELEAAMQAHRSALAHAGLVEQIPFRPQTSLCFVHHEHPQGPRYRLQRTAAGWHWPAQPGLPTHALTTADLLSLLSRDPLRFSTSALLRPLVQDTLLPTAATVGGPGEQRYFAQLSPLYQQQGLPPPVFVPRLRARILDDSTRALLRKLERRPAEVEIPFSDLLSQLSPAFDASQDPQHVLARLQAALAAPLEEVRALDPSLQAPVERTHALIQRRVAHLVSLYQHALRRRDSTRVSRVERVQRMLFPNGAPQERSLSVPYFLAKVGRTRFRQALFSCCSPSVVDLAGIADLVV